MNANLERVTNILKPYLLQDIIVKTDKKIIKKGKLQIFQAKQYFINLSLEINGNIKILEIPYPYKVEALSDRVIFNYHLSSFMPASLGEDMSKLNTSNKTNIYDNLIYILPFNKQSV